MRLWAAGIGLGAAFAFSVGCLPLGTYACAGDENCVRDGQEGACIEGWCAYPDDACDSQLRFDELAGGGLARTCVESGSTSEASTGPDPTTTSTSGSTTTLTPTGDTTTTSDGTGSESTGDTEGDDECGIPGCTDWDGDGYCAEPDSDQPDCDDSNPARFEGCSYISPTGSDDGDGLTPETAWLTFDHAASELQPGDSLVLVDGEYTVATNGSLDVTCGLGGASVGTAAAPISLIAQNERAATVISDGLNPAARLDGCAYWSLTGIHFQSTDAEHDAAMGADGTYVVRVRNSDHNTLRRLLVTTPNRYILTALLRLDSVTNSLIEESEFYEYNHNAVDIQTSTLVTLRRLYANSLGYPDLPGCVSSPPDPTVPRCSSNPAAGGTGFTVNGSQLIVENCASRNNATAGFNLNGENNRLLGALSNQDGTGILVGSWAGGVIEDAVVTRPAATGVYLNATAGVSEATLQHITVVSSQAIGFRNNVGPAGCTSQPQWCETRVRDVVSLDNATSGLLTTGPGPDQWRITTSVFAGNTPDVLPAEPIDDMQGVVRRSSSESPGDIGVGNGQCVLYVPEGSPLKGAGSDGGDQGATVLFRYQNGELTSRPLWHPETSQFPCGAVTKGVNDDPFESCIGLHEWFNGGVAGCELPTSSWEPCP